MMNRRYLEQKTAEFKVKGAEFGIGTHLIIRESTGKAKARRRVISMPSGVRS